MTLELTGKLIVVDATQQVSDKFKKREFVLELAEDAWRIESMVSQHQGAPSTDNTYVPQTKAVEAKPNFYNPSPEQVDDLPF